MRQIVLCCARPTYGQVTAAPAEATMNSRRLMSIASSTASDKPCRNQRATRAYREHLLGRARRRIRLGVSVSFDDPVRPSLVADALADTIIIALDRADGNDDVCAFMSPRA